jgi:predicted ATPase
MKRFILTGAPGSGKTAILRQLEVDGFAVVEEAATDVIALAQVQGTPEPWKHPSFIDSVVALQRRRLERAKTHSDEIQFHDRSAICTAALATYLGHPVTALLSRELERIRREGIFENGVFFVQNLGFIEPTAARRISFEETLRFERIHEETYRGFGFNLVHIEPGGLAERVNAIKRSLQSCQIK